MNLLKKLYRKYILKRNFTDSQVQEMRSEIKKMTNEIEGNNTKSIIINFDLELMRLNQGFQDGTVSSVDPATGKSLDEIRREGTYE